MKRTKASYSRLNPYGDTYIFTFTYFQVCGVSFSKIRYAWQLHAYVVTSRAAEKLIDNLPISAPVDNYVATLIYDGVLTAYAVERRMVAQHGGGYQNRSVDSDIRHSGRL